MDDNDRTSSPTSPSASSSASGSSRDARALVSGRELLDALNGIARDLQKASRRLDGVESTLTVVNTRTGHMKVEQELIGRRVAAMRIESAASMSRIEAATRALDKSADDAAEAVEEVKKESRKLRETGEHLIPQEFDRFEITGKGFRLSATWLRLGGIVKAVPLGIKVLIVVLGMAAAVVAAAWNHIHP